MSARFTFSLIPSILLGCCVALADQAGQAGQASPPSSAEEAPIELARLDITAHPSGADERTAAVWVTRMSEEPPVLHIADLLDAVPGLHLDRAGGAGGRSTLYLRGGEENHTLVFLDGVPLNDPTNSRGGGVDFSLIDPAAIDSAAVVRGPGSMRYGPDAISGVIHLETDAHAAPGLRLHAEAGGDGLGRAAVRGTTAAGSNDTLSVGGTWHDETAESGAGDLRRTFAHAGWRHAGQLDVAVHAWRLDQESRAFPDDSGGVRYAAIRALEQRDDEQTAASARVGRHDDAGSWSIAMDAARLDARTVSPGVAPGVRDPAGLPASVDDIRLARYRLAAVIERKITTWTISGGLDAAREQGRDEAVLDFGVFQLPAGFRRDRSHIGAFLEGAGTLSDALTLSAGVRGDRFDDVGSHVTGRIGILGTLSESTQWRMNAGTGFKAPSFYGLAHPLVGNPELKPERGRSLDAGLRHTFAQGRGLLDLTLFTNELRNGVDFDPGPPPRIANLAQIHSRGAELAALWRVASQLRVSGALTYTDARSQPDDTRMRSRPRWRGALGLAWQPRTPLTIEGRLTAIDSVPDSSIPTGDVMLAGWGRVDLAASWAVNEHWSVSAACDNLLDRSYEEVVGFVAPGRRLRLALQARF